MESPEPSMADFSLTLSLGDEPDHRVKVYSRAHTASLSDVRGFPGQTSSVGNLFPSASASKRASEVKAEAARQVEYRARNREVMRRKQAEQLQRTLARHRLGREKAKNAEHELFEQQYEALTAEESGFINDVGTFLGTQARHEVRKREALHREWDEAIYQKVQAEINAHLEKRPVAQISARRYALLDDYVRVSNSKAYGLFRDIIIPEEYDPMIAHDNPIKYDSRLRFDPCKLELRMHAPPPSDEAGAGAGGFARAGDASQRFPPIMWDKLEATPYGRFNKMMPPPMTVEEAATHRSAVVNDHFDIPQGLAVTAREFPRGKRCFPGSKGNADNVQLGEDPP